MGECWRLLQFQIPSPPAVEGPVPVLAGSMSHYPRGKVVAGEERRRREGLTATERQNTQGWLHVSEPPPF